MVGCRSTGSKPGTSRYLQSRSAAQQHRTQALAQRLPAASQRSAEVRWARPGTSLCLQPLEQHRYHAAQALAHAPPMLLHSAVQ
jgi:hypothetical protein